MSETTTLPIMSKKTTLSLISLNYILWYNQDYGVPSCSTQTKNLYTHIEIARVGVTETHIIIGFHTIELLKL